jgi:3-oxoadipate enol-lactonase
VTDTVVLASSLGTARRMWDPQLGPLGERYRVITYEMRGHGDTAAPQGPYSIADLARDVLAHLDRLAIRRVHFCGLSIGGMIGQWLAAHAPERIERLVLLCTSAHAPPPASWHERARVVRAAGSTAPIADAVVSRWLTPGFAAAHPKLRDRLRAMLLACDPEGYASCCEAIATMDLRAGLGEIRAPTLVVGATDDLALPVAAHTDPLARCIPRARRVVVPGAHMASVESAELVNDLILDHLEAT